MSATNNHENEDYEEPVAPIGRLLAPSRPKTATPKAQSGGRLLSRANTISTSKPMPVVAKAKARVVTKVVKRVVNVSKDASNTSETQQNSPVKKETKEVKECESPQQNSPVKKEVKECESPIKEKTQVVLPCSHGELSVKTSTQQRLLPYTERKESVRNMLEKYRVDDKGISFSHVGMGHMPGRYSITRDRFDNEVWDAYTDFIETENHSAVSIAEVIQTTLPVIVDIDIKVDEEKAVFNLDENGVRHLYTRDQAEQVIKVYNEALSKCVMGVTDNQLKCILLEKEVYQLYSDQKVYHKGGFHLHYPHLLVNAIDMKVHVMPEIMRNMSILGIFNNLGIEDSSSVVDDKTLINPWLLYGGVKEDGMLPYKATCVYDKNVNRIPLVDGLLGFKILKNNKRIQLTESNAIRNLPRILSILPVGKDEFEREVRKDLVKPLLPRPVRKERTSTTKSMDNNIETCAKLMPILSSKRAEDRLDWLQVGWALFNIGNGSDEALDLWLEFSARCPDKYDRDGCEYEWSKMVTSNVTIRTLKYYASIDNPEAYNEFRKNESQLFLLKSTKGTHNEIAKLMYKLYGTDFVCASIAGKVWFQFIGHKWREVEEGCTLRLYISNEISVMYGKLLKEYEDASLETDDKAEQRSLGNKIKSVRRIIENLGSAPFKNNVMRECMEVFYDSEFKDSLNADPYKICFSNGVMDLKKNIFRAGAPEDYISNAMKIAYRDYTHTSPEVEDIHRFLEKVFPDRSLRVYFMDTCADAFVGGNHRKTVVFWTGSGDNSKSITQTIMEKIFGPDLSVKFSTTLVTGKKGNIGTASPELARAGNGVRWATLEEPDDDEQLNTGILKGLSGNDSYFARDLFEKGKGTREITPMFKLTFICNKLPVFRQLDQAMKNRIRVIPFESTFVKAEDPDGYPDTYEEQLLQKRFPMDLEFGSKIPHMLEPFAWVLLEHRKRIGIREEPYKVRQATEQYYKQNDVYKQFIEENVFHDPEAKISLSELYESFKTWFKDGFGNRAVPIKNDLKEYFEKLWGAFDRNRGCIWTSWRLRCPSDNEEGNCIFVDGGQEIAL